MKKLFLAIFVMIFSLSQIYSFTITVQKDPDLKTPVTIKVEIDGIPRTIGDLNFQNIDKIPFETSIIDSAKVTITAKCDRLEVKIENNLTGAQIFTISKSGGKLEIK